LKASSISSINVAVPSGDSAPESYILTLFTHEYWAPNDVSLNDLTKEDILLLTSTPIRMHEEAMAQEPIMSGVDKSKPIQEESLDELREIMEESGVAQEPLDTHNAALLSNIASSKKGRVTNATVKKRKRTRRRGSDLSHKRRHCYGHKRWLL